MEKLEHSNCVRLHFFLANHLLPRGRKTIRIMQLAFTDSRNWTQSACAARECAIHYSIASRLIEKEKGETLKHNSIQETYLRPLGYAEFVLPLCHDRCPTNNRNSSGTGPLIISFNELNKDESSFIFQFFLHESSLSSESVPIILGTSSFKCINLKSKDLIYKYDFIAVGLNKSENKFCF